MAAVSLIGELDGEKVPLLQKFHADFLDSLDMKESSDRMTGVLFVLNQSVMIQVVEAPTKVLVQLMRNLAEVSGVMKNGTHQSTGKMNLSTAAAANAPLGSNSSLTSSSPSSSSLTGGTFIPVDPRFHPLLKSSSILSFSEEVPREFHIWAFRHMKLPSDDFASSGMNLQKDGLKLCFETVKNMLELGRDLSNLTEERAIDYIQTSVARQLTMKLPSAERLIAYIHTLHTDLCTLEEWLEIYDTPIEFTLENEKVWPVEPFLKVKQHTLLTSQQQHDEKEGLFSVAHQLVLSHLFSSSVLIHSHRFHLLYIHSTSFHRIILNKCFVLPQSNSFTLLRLLLLLFDT